MPEAIPSNDHEIVVDSAAFWSQGAAPLGTSAVDVEPLAPVAVPLTEFGP